MAGPWFVDPENGLTTNNGLSPEAPWKLIPGQTGADAQTGYGVVAGDTINVRNGTTTSLRISMPANNLTYRGYGLADNVLYLTLPRKNPALTKRVRVVREPGVHEGMWQMNASGNDDDGMLNFSSRSGCTVEDAHIFNSDVATRVLVRIGAGAQAQIGATVRRCAMVGSVAGGVGVVRPDTLIEDSLIQDIAGDGVSVSTSASQDWHAGRFVRLLRVAIINAGDSESPAIGDPLQLNNTTGYQGTIDLLDSYIAKRSTVKQGAIFAGVAGTIRVDGNHWHSAGDGTVQVAFNGLQAASRVYVTRNYWGQPSANSNPFIRLVDGSMAEGAVMVVDRNIVDVPGTHAGLWSWGSASAGTMAGEVRITNNLVMGRADNGLSWSAAIGVQTASTLDAAASVLVANNAIIGGSPVAIRLPAGANDDRWQVTGNLIFGAGLAGVLGSGAGTPYATVAEFQAGTTSASGNKDDEPMISSSLRPLPGSPLLTQGADLGLMRDINGVQGRKFIGAYTAARLR
jgi:hypothetical protein